MPKPASQAKTIGQANKLTSQKDSGVCLNPLSVQCPGVGTLQELTNCHRPGQLRHANRVVARGRWPKHVLWAAAIQTQRTRYKSQGMRQKSSSRDTCALVNSRGRPWRKCLTIKVSGKGTCFLTLKFALSEIQIATPAVLFSVRMAYAIPFLILTYMNCYIQYT